MSDHVHSFEYYFKRNAFLSGADKLLHPFRRSARQINSDNVQQIVDGLRLQLLARGFQSVEKLLAEYGAPISAVGDIPHFEVMLLRARIAYKSGNNRRAYNLATILIKTLEDYAAQGEDKQATLERSVLLPRIHLIAGKAIYGAMDHSLARIHYCRAYYLLTSSDLTIRPNGKYTYLIGRIYTLLARSYLDYPGKKESINQMLVKAKTIYDIYFLRAKSKGHKPGESSHLYLTEITELDALSIIDSLSLKDWHDAFNKAIKILDEGVRIIDNTFGADRPHRRRAHLFRFKGAAYLKAAIKYRKEASGKFTDKSIKHLLLALSEYKKELKQRVEAFQTEDHPTVCRTYDYLATVYLLMAEAVQGRNEHPLQERYLKLAEQHIDLGVRSNTPGPDLIAEDEAISSHPSAVFSTLPQSADHHCRSRLQQFKLAGKQLHLNCLKYRHCSKAEKKERFAEVLFAYQDCHKYQTKCLEYLYWDESRETIFERFLIMQELALSACQLEFDRNKKLGDEEQRNTTFGQMLQINVHGKRNEDWRPHYSTYPVVPQKVQLNGLRTKMAMIQTFNLQFFFLQPPVTSLKLAQINYPDYYNVAGEILIENFEQISYNKRRLINQQATQLESENYEISARRILREFNTKDPAGLLCFFVGTQHIYLLALYQPLGGKEVSPIRQAIQITSPENAYQEVARIEEHAKELNATIRFLHKMARGIKGVGDVSNKLDLSTAPTDFEKRLIAEESFCFHDNWKISKHESESLLSTRVEKNALLADQINSRWLIEAYALYKLLLVPANIPDHTRRLYLTFNKNWLQETPFNLLPTSDPKLVFAKKDKHFYRDLSYFGTTWQHAVVPCLADLWRLRAFHSDKENDIRKDHGPALDGDELAIFHGIRGIDTKPDQQIDDASLSYIGARHFKAIWDYILNGRTGLDASRFLFAPPQNTPSQRGVEAKTQILDQGQLSLIMYFFCHIEYERTDKLDRKKIELLKAKGNGQGHHRSPFDIYHEEIAESDYRNNWLVFINGCGAAQGAARTGYVPFSIMAAFLDGGSRAVIGTQFISYATPARHYARKFLSFWVGIRKGEGIRLGEALLETNRLLLHNSDKNYAKFANPIHWGTYLLLGDTTVNFEQLMDFLEKKRP